MVRIQTHFLYVNIQFLQYHLLKSLSFRNELSWLCYWKLIDHIGEDLVWVLYSTPLVYMSVLRLCHIVVTTVAFQFRFYSGDACSPILFCFFFQNCFRYTGSLAITCEWEDRLFYTLKNKFELFVKTALKLEIILYIIEVLKIFSLLSMNTGCLSIYLGLL